MKHWAKYCGCVYRLERTGSNKEWKKDLCLWRLKNEKKKFWFVNYKVEKLLRLIKKKKVIPEIRFSVEKVVSEWKINVKNKYVEEGKAEK